MFKNSKQIVLIVVCMLFSRNDQYQNYNTRQSRSLHPSVGIHPSVGRGEAIYNVSICANKDLIIIIIIIIVLHIY